MKKILSIVGLALMASGLFAAEFDTKSFAENYQSGSYDAIISAFEGGKAQILKAKPYPRRAAAFYYVAAKAKKGGVYKNSSEALTEFYKLFAEFGATGDATQQIVTLHQIFGEDAKAVEIARKSTHKGAQFRGCVSLARLKKYEEAADWAATIELGHAQRSAITWARLAKAPAKVLTYGLKAVNSGAFTAPADVKKLVEYVLATNFEGSTVTDVQIKAFLQTVNRRCSRFLKPGNPTAWDEVIQLVRQTLETY